MKPCAQYRESIACSVTGGLEPGLERKLQEHFKQCPACRQCHDELSRVARSISAASPPRNVRASDAFHQRLEQRLNELPQRSGLWGLVMPWRTVFAVTAVAAVLALTFLLLNPRDLPKATTVALVVPVAHQREVSPTLAAYQQAARQSSEALDAMMRRQVYLPSFPESRLTASQLARIELEAN